MFKISFLASSGIFIFVSGLAWGATTFKDGVISSDKVIEKKATPEKSNSTQVVNNIPDWCAQLPSSDFALYACGIGNSGNLTMARRRAALDAKRQLADSIDSQISSRMNDFLDAISTGDEEEIKQLSTIVTANVTIEAKLSGYKKKRSFRRNTLELNFITICCLSIQSAQRTNRC